MKLKRGQRHKIVVTYKPGIDLYDVELIHIRNFVVTVQEKREDVYAEDLSGVIYQMCNK